MRLFQKGGFICDSRCYNAKSHNCNCVCHGKNHGVGLQQAVANTQALAQDDEGMNLSVKMTKKFPPQSVQEYERKAA